MKASELIEKLNKMIETSGDHEVVVPSIDEDEIFAPIHSLTIGMNGDKPYQIALCDKETALSFI